MDNPIKMDEQEIKRRLKLPMVLGIAAAIAVVMTIISVAIYYMAGFYKLDLSRPGYEIEREDVFTDEVDKTYDETSSLNPKEIDKVLTEFDERVKGLNSYGNFNDNNVFSDETILIGQ
jgi:hypothetical protein